MADDNNTANQPPVGEDLRPPFPPPVAVPEEPPNESGGFSGLLALWGPLILVGALIFVFQGGNDVKDLADTVPVAMTSPASTDTPPQVITAPIEAENQSMTQAESAEEQALGSATAAVMSPEPDPGQPMEGTEQLPPMVAVAKPIATMQTPIADDSSPTNVVHILVYPPVAGPYRVHTPWRTTPVASVHGQPRWPSSASGTAAYGGDSHWIPCPPPHYWCIAPARMKFDW